MLPPLPVKSTPHQPGPAPRRFRIRPVIFGCVAGAFVLFGAAAALTSGYYYTHYRDRAAQYDLSKIGDLPERSRVFDTNGEFYSFFGGENRLVVPLDRISPHFVQALLAREDSRFWEHHGVDPRGIARAALANARAGGTRQGASTITQQLARNACGLGERTFDRKALEAALARRIEDKYTKQQILELYANRIYFGSGFYGVESAARGYFGKPAADLTLGEGAALAALIRNPNRLSPSRNLDGATQARDEVLDRMAKLQMISANDREAARAQPLKVSGPGNIRVTDDDVMDAVSRELATLLAPETIDYGGLKITMTIDPGLQKLAQTAADRRLSEIEEQKGFPHPRKQDFVAGEESGKEKPTDYLQAAVVMIDNRTGAIRAAVGGRDYRQSKYQRALVAKRQIGSTFKPFVYATAFDRGLLPGTAIDDSKIAPGEFSDLPKKWSPENSDGEYGGFQPASLGLIKSRNTMSVRVGEYASLGRVREVARRAGLGEDIPALPVVFLGAFESTARDVTAAYTIFPNRGVYRAPYLISKVEDQSGHVLWKAKSTEEQVISRESAWMTSSILQQVMKTGTASKATALGWKKVSGGKTGTTNDFFDAWFVGYTSSMTCGVWVGMDQPQTIMEKGYGSALALPIWTDIMRQLPEKDYPAESMGADLPFRRATLCSASGELATPACHAQHCAYDMDLPTSRVPAKSCHVHREAPAPLVAAMPLPATPVPAVVPATPAPSVSVQSARVQTTAPVGVAHAPLPPPSPVVSTMPVHTPSALPAEVLPPPARALPPDRRSVPPPVVVQHAPVSALPVPRKPTTIDIAGEQASVPDGSRRSPVATRNVPPPVNASPESEQPSRSARSVASATSSGTRVEVRRAIPVAAETPSVPPPPVASGPAEDAPAANEQRIVEQLPDGRTRITTIRRVRGGAKAQSAPPKHVEAARKQERERED